VYDAKELQRSHTEETRIKGEPIGLSNLGGSWVVASEIGEFAIVGARGAHAQIPGNVLLNGFRAQGDQIVAVGTTGKFWVGSPPLQFTPASLKKHDIRKPGRDIFNVIADRVGQFLLIGAKGLVCSFDGVSVSDVSEGVSDDLSIHYAVQMPNEILLSGLRGFTPSVARLASSGFAYVDFGLWNDDAAPVISANQFGLLLGGRVLAFLMNGDRKDVELLEFDDYVVSTCSTRDGFVAATAAGRLVRLDEIGNVIRGINVFT
jgi:hypothetical protein